MLTAGSGSSSKVDAELRFRLEEGDSIFKGEWFSKERLVSASPWDIVKMQTMTYTYFSIEGMGKTRRFYQSQNNDGCHVTAGFMLTTDEEGDCPWEKLPKTVDGQKPVYARYMWAEKNKMYGVWSTADTRDSDEFRLIGDTEKKHYIYYAE